MLVVPVLLGIFLGAPVLAREFESGTFRFAWTQGCGRLRWAVSKLVLLAVVITAVAWAFTELFGWYYHAFLADGQVSRLLPLAFGLLGVAFAAWTLAAFAMRWATPLSVALRGWARIIAMISWVIVRFCAGIEAFATRWASSVL